MMPSLEHGNLLASKFHMGLIKELQVLMVIFIKKIFLDAFNTFWVKFGFYYGYVLIGAYFRIYFLSVVGAWK